FDGVTKGTVSRAPFRGHASKNRHISIDVIDNENVCFPVMPAMKSTDILGQCPFPRDGHSQEQYVEPGVVEPFAIITARAEYQAFFATRYAQCGFGTFTLGCRHASAHDDEVLHKGGEPVLKIIEVVLSLGQDDG